MRILFIALVTLALGAAAPLPFDQQAYISQDDAVAAAALFSRVGMAYSLCEPCGDTTPTRISFTHVDARWTGFERYYQVHLDGQGRDLAYTYIPVQGSPYLVNVALLMGLPASDVTPVIGP